jgi:hypothetical protein
MLMPTSVYGDAVLQEPAALLSDTPTAGEGFTQVLTALAEE